MWHGAVPFAAGERLTVTFDIRLPIRERMKRRWLDLEQSIFRLRSLWSPFPAFMEMNRMHKFWTTTAALLLAAPAGWAPAFAEASAHPQPQIAKPARDP